MLEAMSSCRSHSHRGTQVGRTLGLGALAVAAVLPFVALFAVEARAAGSYDDSPPRAVLMKSAKVLQLREPVYAHWFFYDDGNWVEAYYDSFDFSFPEADEVAAGRRLHIRFRKPERPTARIVATPTRRFSSDRSRELMHAFRPVEQDGGVGRVLQGQPARPRLLPSGLPRVGTGARQDHQLR
jgi:hypothetical protein